MNGWHESDHKVSAIALQKIVPAIRAAPIELITPLAPASFRVFPRLGAGRIEDPFRDDEISSLGVAKSELDRYIRTHPG